MYFPSFSAKNHWFVDIAYKLVHRYKDALIWLKVMKKKVESEEGGSQGSSLYTQDLVRTDR